MTDDISSILEPRSSLLPSTPAKELNAKELRDTIQEGVFRGAMKAVAVYGLIGFLVWMVITLAACSKSPAGPAGLDPIVLTKNLQSTYPASITWWDQSGQVQRTVLSSNSTTCVKFTATNLADSVRFEIVIGDTTGGPGQPEWYKQWSPWFDPKTGVGPDVHSYPYGAEFWTLDIVQVPSSTLLKAVSSAPC